MRLTGEQREALDRTAESFDSTDGYWTSPGVRTNNELLATPRGLAEFKRRSVEGVVATLDADDNVTAIFDLVTEGKESFVWRAIGFKSDARQTAEENRSIFTETIPALIREHDATLAAIHFEALGEAVSDGGEKPTGASAPLQLGDPDVQTMVVLLAFDGATEDVTYAPTIRITGEHLALGPWVKMYGGAVHVDGDRFGPLAEALRENRAAQ